MKNFLLLLLLLSNWKIWLMVISAIAPYIVPSHLILIPAWTYRVKFPEVIWAWANFDGDHYIKIADLGYGLLEQGFFPLYPLFIRIGFQVFHLPYLISALVISHVSLFLGLGFSALLLILDERKIPMLFFLIIFMFPTSFFYTAAYNDALFFCLATLTILLTRKRLWIFAGVTGGLATLTRLNGLALIFLIVFEFFFGSKTIVQIMTYIDNFRFNRKSSILLIPIFSIIGAFIGYLGYVQFRFGHWWMVFESMQIWAQNKLTFPPQVLWRYIKILLIHPSLKFPYYIALGELIFIFFYLFLLLTSISKLRASYWIFFGISLLIPMLTGTFQGMPRYGLHLYPMYLSLYYFLQRQTFGIRICMFFAFVLLLIAYEMLFLRGYFVA